MKVFAWVSAAIIAWVVMLVAAFSAAMGGGLSAQVPGGFSPGANLGLSAEQKHNATIILTVADEEHADGLDRLAQMTAALGESNLKVVPNGSGSGYCGVFQADPDNIPCGDTREQAYRFLRGGKGFQAGGAIELAKNNPGMSPGTIATKVEASGQPGSWYDVNPNGGAEKAQQIIEAWVSGGGDAQSLESLGTPNEVRFEGGLWLTPVPGVPGTRCDTRIVADVVALIEHYHVQPGDCYASSGHASDGEHPLGLGIDLVPGPGGSWDDVDRLARDSGWIRSCGASGVRPACPLKPWLRFVGYDGYQNHGRGNHLHLSWEHGPGSPAQTVRIFSGS